MSQQDSVAASMLGKKIVPERRAIFLGAGIGSRLHPYTAECPKWELEVGGQKILERLIGCAHECGITDVVVVRGTAGGSVRCPSVQYVDDLDRHNMVHSLFKARKYLTGDVVISYADVLYEPDVLRLLLACDSPIAVVVDHEWQSLFRTRAESARSIAESLSLDQGRIKSIGQPLTAGEMPEAQYIGLIKLSGEGAALFQSVYDELLSNFGGRPWRNARRFEDCYMTDFLQEFIERQIQVIAVPIRGGWVEFDTPGDYEHVVDWIATGEIERYLRMDLIPKHPSVLSAGGVVMRQVEAGWQTLLGRDKGLDSWRLPKGMQMPGERILSTAVREVREETGIDAEILGYVGLARWTYTFASQHWDHRVHFFLMQAVGGSINSHDSEFSAVEWWANDEIPSRLFFESEKQIFANARSLIVPQFSR